MARRTPKADSVETTEVTTDESTATQTTTEAPASEATTKKSSKKEKVVSETATPEVEIDLTEFTNAAKAALDSADKATGAVPQESIDSVNKVYRTLEGQKGKNAARHSLDAQMKDALEGNGEYAEVEQTARFILARGFMAIRDGLKASGGTTPKAPADPTEAFVQKVTAIRLAYAEVTANVPEGVSEDWAAKADELAASVADDIAKLKGFDPESGEDAPEVNPVAKAALKLAEGKAVRGGGGSRKAFDGPRRDVMKHVESAFADKEVGAFLTVTEVAKAQSEEYGDDRPSAGAVSARFFGKDGEVKTVGNLQGVAEPGQPRGIRKVA